MLYVAMFYVARAPRPWLSTLLWSATAENETAYR